MAILVLSPYKNMDAHFLRNIILPKKKQMKKNTYLAYIVGNIKKKSKKT